MNDEYINKRYGLFTIIKFDEEKSNKLKRKYYICKCDCGNIKSIRLDSLKSGETKSCGCNKLKIIDLTGKRFGRLVVLKLDEEKTKLTGRTYWICKCDCGNNVSVLGSNLKRGNTSSCGCLNLELSSKRLQIINSKSNRIEFDSNLGCLRVYFNNCDEYFLCDVEDRDIAEKYCWYKDGEYVKSHNSVNGSTVRFHRLVLEKYNIDLTNYVIDHINHNTLDNRKYNLRVCTVSQNRTNSRPTSNTGEKYISYDKSRKKFQCKIDGESTKLFNSSDEAVVYRDDYLNNHPNEFRYNSDEDYINRNNPNIIHPFEFIPNIIIKPFDNL